VALFDILRKLVDVRGEERCARLLGKGLIGFLAFDDIHGLRHSLGTTENQSDIGAMGWDEYIAVMMISVACSAYFDDERITMEIERTNHTTMPFNKYC